MGRPPSSNSKRNKQRREEYGKERMLDKLALFEDLQATILPKLMKLLASGADSATMRKEMDAYMEARKLSIALTSKDEGKALAAITDAQNRNEGKPKEAVTHTHRYENMPEQELDAVLLSKLSQASDDDEERDNH